MVYKRRIKVFIILSVCLLSGFLLRLTQMQLLPDSSLQDSITELKRQRGLRRQLKTVRGEIFDRKGRVLATDELKFQLHISYRLSSFFDERVQRAKLLRATGKNEPRKAVAATKQEIGAKLRDLQQVIDKCAYFGLEREDVENRIKRINDETWKLRSFLAWARNRPGQEVLEKYNRRINAIPLSEAIADFEKKFPDEDERLVLTAKVDNIAEMDESWALLELKTDDDIFTAQLEFMDIAGVSISPQTRRFYPFGAVAAQTIGWVGPARDRELFADDALSRYLKGEVSGRRPGAEYVCEGILRGRRGQVVYDIDHKLVDRTERRFGRNVSLTLDIELQEKIEKYLADCDLNPNCLAPTAAIVIEVASGDVLALVSMPTFDLNRIRYDYGIIADDPNQPLRNREINKQYPPGSVVKPLILVAGLEAGKITPGEVINCPAEKAPKGWPSCWLYNRYHGQCHDDKWKNNARNAIRGSCNIYFSRLAERIEPVVLQQWLFKLGYGRKTSLAPCLIESHSANGKSQSVLRDFKQVGGTISSSVPGGEISSFEQVSPLRAAERRYFGIGQGNLRATPLQVANAMACLARGGLYTRPRLLRDDDVDDGSDPNSASVGPSGNFAGEEPQDVLDLNISPGSLDVVRDGMSAVVNEPGGTAYTEFAHAGFAGQGVEVYGKTGSTEKPDHAWFGGFAEDKTGRAVSIAVVVEGGQHGSSDAGPLARDIIQFCIEAGYIGEAPNAIE